MERNVTSLETSRKLKEAGFPQKTAYWWCEYTDGWSLQDDPYNTGDSLIAAPTAQEIANELDVYRVEKRQSRGGGLPPITVAQHPITGEKLSIGADLAGALAALYIKLKEEKTGE